jgi:uncharacterized repeat protein (TIGR03803 family)
MRSNTILYCGARLLAALALYPILAIAASAQTYTILHSFDVYVDGATPETPLVQGFDGQFYGTSAWGGPGGRGTFFKIGRYYGKMTILHNFADNPVGDAQPAYNLIENEGGTFYGTTVGSTVQNQELYRMSETGDEKVLLNFCTQPKCTDGVYATSLIWDWNHNLIATLSAGGGNGQGVIFSITPGGRETTLHGFFCFGTYCPYGNEPWQMIQASDGNLYGVASFGGAKSSGTVYTVGPSRPFTKLYDFCSQADCADGGGPVQLIQGSDGNLYGTTQTGGAYGAGTIFKMTTAGVLTTLYNFCSPQGCTSGRQPAGTLVEGTDGNFYGVNYYGGEGQAEGNGTIFKFTPTGEYTLLYNFPDTNGWDGQNPTSLVQGTDGAFYGTTDWGGTPITGMPVGVIFRLDVGLGPFVQPLLAFGRVGDCVNLLGTNLTGATAVSFNGTPATIDKITPYRIQTTVPAGATSGTITVTLPTGTLSSNLSFTVVP